MRRIITMFITAAIISAPAPVSGQRVESIHQGAKIRVSTTGNTRQVGFLDSLTSETIAMRVVDRDQRASSLSVGRGKVTRLEVRGTNRFKGALKGAGMGLGAGFLSGFVLGVLLHEDEENCFIFCSAMEAGLAVGAFGGVIAAPIGLVAGASAGAGTWKRVDPASAKLK
jgi:hypothetical protein